MKRRLVIIGMDGLTFDCTEPLIKAGFLPEFSRTIKSGTSAILRSTTPPCTAPAWVSFATGCNPGKHGCFDFLVPHGPFGHFRTVNSRDIRTQTFYEIAAEAGMKVVLINLPVSYPPLLSGPDNIVITSLMTRGDQAVFPRQTVERFPILKRYRIYPDPYIAANGTDAEYIQDVMALERVRFECGRELYRGVDWDIFFYLISGTDWVQHRRHEHLLQPRAGSPELKAFAEFDKYLGWFLDNLPAGAHLIIVSDHGFMRRKGIFFLNTWLWKEGYLKVHPAITESPRPSTPQGFARAQALRKRKIRPSPGLLRWIDRFPALWDMARLLSRPFKRALRLQLDYCNGNPVPEESRAFCPWEGMWGIFLNEAAMFHKDSPGEGAPSRGLAEEIKEKLLKLKDPEENLPVFEAVFLREELYTGPWVHLAPQLVLHSSRFQIDTTVTQPGLLFRRARHQGHSPYGVLVAAGPQARRNERIEEVSIMDVAPTLLHLLGLPIPSDRDGRILQEIFRPGSEALGRPPRQLPPTVKTLHPLPPSCEEERVVEERLRSLGYL